MTIAHCARWGKICMNTVCECPNSIVNESLASVSFHNKLIWYVFNPHQLRIWKYIASKF
jgi:hypothetical protein